MTTYSPLFLLAALGLLCSPGAALAAADTANWKCSACPYPKGTTSSVDAGLGVVSADSKKFGDFSGLQDKGAHAVLGGSVSVRGESGYYADVRAADLGLDTRSLGVTSGHEGQYSLHLGYAELPRHFADGAMTPYLGNGGSRLTLPAGYPAPNTTAMPLAGTLQPVDIGFKKKRLDVSAALMSFQDWTYRLSFSRDARDGTRPMTAGYFATAQQVVAPVDHTTDQFEVSAAYTSRSLQAKVAYQISRFGNGHESLTIDNPFSPVLGASLAQVALAPSNQMHQIVASAGMEIMPEVRASADVSYGRLTQDAGFMPATLNSALGPSVPALPAASLNGTVDTFNANLRLTATPMVGLRVNASYAHNARENKTDIAAYPQVAADIFLRADTRSNVPFSFTQDRFKVGADYRAADGVKLSAGADQDYRRRPYHEVLTTRETTFWGRAGVQLGDDMNVAFKVGRSQRTHSDYGVSTWFGSTENPLLRKYNLAERQRDSAGLRADFTGAEKVSFGLFLDYSNDAYSRSLVGLQNARSVSVGADISAALSEHTQLTFFAQNEQLRSRQAGSQAGNQPDWTALGSDSFDVLGLGLKHTMLGDKLEIGADLVLSRSTGELSVDHVQTLPAFPLVRSEQETLKLHARYKLADNLWLNGSFWHERLSAADWRLDGVQPATVQNLLSLGAQSPHYRVNVLSVSVRYQF
jgi:MtrB/PioB family decaheme-associated outer membrane protein